MESRDAKALHELVDLLDGIGVPYCVGGSVASSYVGEPRSTMDVDLLVELRPRDVPALVSALASHYYFDEASIREAVSSAGTFQALHLGTYTKFDLFVSRGSELDVAELERRVLRPLGDGTDRKIHVAAAETIVLRKLDWFRRGGGVSDRQWRDVLGVLKRQGPTLDVRGMKALAKHADLEVLLDKAFEEAGT